MKRDPALVTLSHDHHLALYVARTLKRATAETASDGRAAFVELLGGARPRAFSARGRDPAARVRAPR